MPAVRLPAAPERRRDRVRAVLTWLAVAAIVAAVPLLAQGYRELRSQEGVDHVALQFAGGRQAACRVIQPGASGCPVPETEVERYAAAVRADWYLVAGYVLAGLGAFGLGALFLYGTGAQRVARWCLGGVLLAGAADAQENLALLRGLDGLGQAGGDGPFALAASLAVLKFAAGGPLLPVFVVVASVLAARRVYGPSRVVRREDVRASDLDPGTTRRPDIILPPAVPTPRRPPSRPPSASPAPTSSRSCTPSRAAPGRPGRRPRSAAIPTPTGQGRPGPGG